MSEVKINDLKKLAKQRDQQAIIAFCVERDGTVRCVTYGENPLKCRAAGWWGQGFLQNQISKVPFQTIFGMGNGGKPKFLSDFDTEILRLNDKIPNEFLGPIERTG